jgi:hypothetical protein
MISYMNVENYAFFTVFPRANKRPLKMSAYMINKIWTEPEIFPLKVDSSVGEKFEISTNEKSTVFYIQCSVKV